MDNFVTELKKNINIDSKTGEPSKSSRLRELLYYVSVSDPEISVIDKCDEDGDIKFEVPMKTMGITNDLMIRFKKEICSDFVANFLGELLIRENINQFAQILTNIHPELYPSVVNRFEHRKFGMDINKDKLIFCFHISLLEDIMLEDIKRKVR